MLAFTTNICYNSPLPPPSAAESHARISHTSHNTKKGRIPRPPRRNRQCLLCRQGLQPAAPYPVLLSRHRPCLGLDALEDEAIRRAREGVVEPVFQAGLHCGNVRKYSDLLLIFLLKSRRPHRYAGAIPRDSPAVPPPLITLSHPSGPASPIKQQPGS